MKTIPLTKGQVAIVDDDDHAALSEYVWCAVWYPDSKTYYARRSSDDNKSRKVYMHRQIMAAQRGAQVDHRNHNGLDNRRENLRLCTFSQNGANKRKKPGCTSRFKGVCWFKPANLWMARVRGNLLGYFKNELDAARAYNAAARATFGEFALLNDIEEEDPSARSNLL